MRAILAVIIIFTATLSEAQAQAQEGTFLGVFTTADYPVSDCRITRASNSIGQAFFGHGRFGLDFEQGVLRTAAENAVTIFESLEEEARSGGFNAVVGAKIEISHTGDAVFESGQNWRAGDDAFDSAGSYIVVAYGTPVTVTCP